MMEMTWLLTHKCDFTMAQKLDMRYRHVMLDYSLPGFHHVPRIIPPVIAKTHLPISFAENMLKLKKPKIIVGLRNPKDALVSFYHYSRSNVALGLFKGSWDEFFELYRSGGTCYGDVFDFMVGWWKKREDPNVLVVKYEDFEEQGAISVVQNAARFLGVEVDTQDAEAVARWISFSSMKDNPMTNYSYTKAIRDEISPYMRKGITGDWVNYFSPEQNAYMDRLYEQKCVPAGLTFTFKTKAAARL